MAEKDNFEQMMDIWSESQASFFKAQQEVIKGFEKSLSSFGGASSGNQMADTMATSMASWQSFIKSWAPDWDPSSMMMNADKSQMFTKGSDAFMAMFDPANWTNYAPEQLRIILQSISQGPQFADIAMPQIDAAEAWRETLDYQQASIAMAKVLQEAWARTFERYSEKYTLDDLRSGNVKEALDEWLKAANAELLETQRTQAFMDAQRGMLRASMEIKARQRETAEAWSDAYQMPTRTEIDDLAKTVHELRREMRILKRQVAAMKVGK